MKATKLLSPILASNQSIGILGLGYLGNLLASELAKRGHKISGTTRSEEKKSQLIQQGWEVTLLNGNDPSRNLFESDFIILNIPPFPGQLDWFKSWPWRKETRIIFISSTSVYEEAPELVSESSPVKQHLLADEEQWVSETFPESTILRPGGLLGRGRHPGKVLSGRKDLKAPYHPVNLIHVEDLVGTIIAVLEKGVLGIINVVSEEHSLRKEFYQGYCRRNSLPLPEFDETDMSSGKIVSNDLLKTFYELKIPRVSERDL